MRVQQLPLTITEKDFQQTVIDTAMHLQWLVTHFRPARLGNGKWVTAIQGYPGFPDLAMARDGVLLTVELKRHGGRPSRFQLQWAAQLGGHYRFWTPVQWNDGTILETLKNPPLPAVPSDHPTPR